MVNIQLTGHNIDVTQPLEDFVNSKLSKLAKHADNITSIHVILDVTKLRQVAEAKLHIPGHEIYAKTESEDMYKTIDLLLDKLIKQIKKHKGKAEHH